LASVIWITGISASGKTSLARALVHELEAGAPGGVALFDGDEFRARLDRRYGHDLADRFAVLDLLVEAVRDECRNRQVVVVAAVSHKREMRAHARRRLGHFLEVFLDCPAEVCASRDPKDLYRRARAGELSCFPGVTEPYERSEKAAVVLDTATLSVESALRRLLPEVAAFLAAP
jgi:adenylylsulfate kinase-like enzyme